MATAEALGRRTPEPDAPETDGLSADVTLRQLEDLLRPIDRFTLMRVRAGDWEARTLAGDVGRGDTPAAAILALVEAL